MGDLNRANELDTDTIKSRVLSRSGNQYTRVRGGVESLTQVLVDEGSRRQCVDGKETKALVLRLHDVQSSVRSTLESGYDRAGQSRAEQERIR